MAEIERLTAEVERKCQVIDIAYDRCIKAETEIERLTKRCYPNAVVMIDGGGHYVNEMVKAEIERLRAALERIANESDDIGYDIAREALEGGDE
jgi:hypothetical protein